LNDQPSGMVADGRTKVAYNRLKESRCQRSERRNCCCERRLRRFWELTPGWWGCWERWWPRCLL